MPFRWNAVLEIDPIAGTARAPLCPKSCLTTTRPGTTEYATCCTSGEPLALPPCIGMHKDNETNTVTGAKDKILCYTPDPWANKYKWSGGVLAPDGRIFAIPRTARAVLIIDPTPGALRLDYTSLAGITNTKGYSGGVLASNGKIYGIPYGANTVLVIDPITMSYDVTTIAIGHAASAWSGGVLAPNGDIYAIPYTATSVLIIDTERNQTDIEPIYGVSVGMQKQWDGGVLVSDGTMFGIPASADSLLRIAPQIRTFVFRGCQGICPNNTYGNGNGTCFRCPPHSTTNGSTGWSTKSACTCVPGTFDDGHTCSLCQPNTFAFAAGQSSCTDCPNHTYTNESSGAHMCECKPGTESHVPPGWTVVLKSDGDATFAYDAPMWTDTSVFNVDSDPTQAGNAKYPGYNEFSFDAVTACVHTLDNCLTPHEFSVPIGSASTLFGDNHRSIGKSGTNTSRNDFIGVMKPNIRRQAGEVEAGTITVGDRMTNVYFSGPKFVNPVVILGIASRNSHVEIVPRITRITGTGFDVYIDVPNHAEGVGPYCGTTAHAAETLSWAVAESGDAEHLRAGTIDSASDFQWKAVSFGTAFTSVPIIVSQIQTHRDDDWVTTRHKNVSVIGFEVRMEEDGLDTTHPREMIGWFAVPIGNSTAYGRTFEGVLIPSVSHHPTVINFQSSFSSVPTLFGSIFTERSQDPAHLRQHNTAISTRNATIFIEEEGCSDADMQHSEAEAVHILIIGHSKGSGRDCPAQRFGFNTYCNADLKVRWGYCGDRPIDPCQFDSEYTTLYSAAIGFGLSRDVGAGYTHSFVNNENIVQNNSRAQVWILVRNVPAANTTATCELCRVGTYKDVGGPSKCRSCPPFSSTISSGSTHATACICNAGFTMPGIVTQASNATCAACPHNFYKDQPGSGPCTPCPPHSTTASSVGAVSIAQCLCEAGYEGNVSLGSPCKPCEANTYKPSVGPQSCAACPWNSKTRTVGSTSIQSCICAEGFEVNMLYAGNGGLLDWGDHSAGSTVHTNWTSSLRRALGDSLSVEDCGALGSWLMTKSGPTAWRTLARTFDTRHVSHSALRIEIEVLAVDYLARSLRTRMFLNGQAIEATGTRTCSDVIAYNVSAVSGVYTLEINGVPTSVYCNVSSPRNGTYRPDIWALVYQTQGTSNMDTNSAVNATALAQSGLSGLRTSGKLSKGAIQLLCSRYKVTSSAQLPPINNNLPINETIISLKPYATHDSNRTIESNMQIWCQSDPLPMAAANATECYGATPQDVVRISTIARHSGAIANISLEVYSSKVGIRGMHITTGTMDGFDNSIDSWGSNVKPALRPAICGSLGPFLGGTRSMAGELVANTWVEKAFDVNSQPHDVVSLTLTVVALRAWGAGHVVVTADGLKIWTQKDFDGHSYQSCGDIRAKTIVLGPVDIPHNASVFTVRVAGSSHMAGSFAIDDVAVVPRLRWCTACQVGQYKTDRNNTGCTACPDYSTTASTTSVNLSSCTCLQGFTGDIVTDGDRCSILPKATIKTSGRNAPTVTVKWRSGISGGTPNLHKRLVLVSNISASGTVTLEWTAVQLAKENMVDLQNPKEVRLDGLSATALNVTIAPSPSGTISPLVIRPNSFTVAREQGMFCKTECGDGTAIYLFKLRATLVSDSSAWSEATVLVVMNPPPIGAVSIQPSSGQAVSTVFNLTATNWVDTDLPLTYEFFSASGTTSQGILAMHSSASNLAIALPQGDAKEDFKLAVGVRVTDSFEGVGQATTIATVTQFVLAPNADILSMADQFLAGTDTDSVATASRVNAFASTLMTIDTAKAKSVRDKLMDRLLTSVVNPSTDWTDSHTSACLAAAVTVTASAEQMSATATDQGLSLLTTMSSKITPSLASTAASTVSNLMAATEHAHNQTTKGTESPGEGRQQKASRDAAASRRSRALVSILDSITISLNAGRLPGEEPATIQTPKFQLEAHVMNSHTFEQKEPTRRRLRAAGGVSSLHVSRGALDEFSIGSAQIINWASTGNPHFWKGERMDAARPWAPSWNQPVKLATDVFTVSFFNATGGKMNISNLHKSAVVQLQGDSSLPNSSTVHCAFWETKQLRWKVDSIGKLLPDGTIECATTHFTDFAAFAGAPPQFNRLGKLSDLVHNPFGMRVVLFMVSAALLICVVAYLDYGRFIHNATSRKSSTRRKFDTRTSSFARISRLKNSPAVPWSSRAFIRMRTMWLPGGCCFAYEGDPYSRSNRLLLFVLHILVLLGVGILFFDGYTECTYPCDVGRYPNASEMPDECKVCLKEQDCSAENTSTATHAIVDSPSSRVCPETPETDALNNGFLTALLQCALVIPLIGVMNLWLAWLRQPLHANIMARSGEMLERIETKHFDEYHLDQVRKSRCSLCRDWCRSLLPNAKSCITVQIECICARCCRRNRTTLLVDGPSRNDDGSCLQDMPRNRAPACDRRRKVASQMRICEQTVDALWFRFDRNDDGVLDKEELSALMREVVGSSVTESDVDFVLAQADPTGGGLAEREQLKTAITLWRYLHHESDFVSAQFDSVDINSDGVLSLNEVGELLTILNDGMPPTLMEVEWVMKQADENGDGSLDGHEVRAAVALWYPAVYNRRWMEDLSGLRRAPASHRRKAISAQLGLFRDEAMQLVARGKRLRKAEGEGGNNAKRRKKRKGKRLYQHDVTRLMADMSDGNTPSQRDVDMVLMVADCSWAESFAVDEIVDAVAMWKCLQGQEWIGRFTGSRHTTDSFFEVINTQIQNHDPSNSSVFDSRKVRQLLVALNDNHPVTPEETGWVIESSMTDSNTLDRDELRASIVWWYLRVPRTKIRPHLGIYAVAPYGFAAVISLLCAYLVARVSSQWNEDKTRAWIYSSGLALVLKLIVYDLGRTVFCTCLEPVIALFSPEICVSDSWSGLTQQGAETMGDILEDQTDDMAAAIAAGMNMDSVFAETDEKSDEQKRREQQNAVLTVGTLTAAKMVRKVHRQQARTKSAHAMTVAVRDHQEHSKRLAVQRSNSNALYAEKIAQKRLRKGMNRGQFAARAEVDMLSVTKYLGTKAHHHHEGGNNTGLGTTQGMPKAGQNPTDILNEAMHERDVHMSRIQRMQALKSSRVQERVMRRAGLLDPTSTPPADTQAQPTKKYSRTGHVARGPTRLSGTESTVSRTTPTESPSQLGRSASARRIPQTPDSHHSVRPAETAETNDSAHLDDATIYAMGMYRSPTNRAQLKVRVPPLPNQVTRHAP
jgi:Ca2+-binding EF-hand superfamily protein